MCFYFNPTPLTLLLQCDKTGHFHGFGLSQNYFFLIKPYFQHYYILVKKLKKPYL